MGIMTQEKAEGGGEAERQDQKIEEPCRQKKARNLLNPQLTDTRRKVTIKTTEMPHRRPSTKRELFYTVTIVKEGM